ncbi:MAG: CYTH domain-containing protein [Candidatus Marinimicrobia bacterium]|nr:CYTH domain-containing protein [Candidatus Neomarinimicrobiota bacterium]
MGKEIERKFLVDQSSLPSDINGTEYSQSYISINESGVVRVRIKEETAVLTIKSGGLEISRDEFEYEIPLEDAKALQNIFNNEIIYKTRYNIIYKGKKWEVDQFHKQNKGLWIAEIELESEGESFDVPEWVLEEVTGDEKYYNSNLSKHPYNSWQE